MCKISNFGEQMNIIEGELNMKKLVLIAVLCVSAISANAQKNGQSLLQQLLGNDATSGTLKNILEDVVGGAVAKLDLSIEGTWKYLYRRRSRKRI